MLSQTGHYHSGKARFEIFSCLQYTEYVKYEKYVERNSQPRLRWKAVSCSVAVDSGHVGAFHCIHIRPSFLR